MLLSSDISVTLETGSMFAFRWNVPEAGYRWVKTRTSGKTRWVLSDRVPDGSAYRAGQYAPLKLHPALFRTFAHLPSEERERLLEFANAYGYLGVEPEETHETWMQRIGELRRAIAIWDLIHDRDAASLRPFFIWKESEYAEDGYTVISPGGWYYRMGAEGERQWIDLPPEVARATDVLIPALFLVQRWVNAHLRHAAPRLVYDSQIGKPVFQVVPANLLAAMWLQLAESMSGNKQYRTCKECGKWFEISSDDDGRTARRLFCDDPCKSRDYRRRKERAQQLRTKGKPVKDIAKELDTDVETIKKWLSKRRR
jgi:hypothetical protein